MKKKIFIFLPDGVGLRNFAFTDFYEKMKRKNEVVFWNNTGFKLKERFGVNEIFTGKLKTHFLTDLLKRAKNNIILKQSYKRTGDRAYLSYIFPRKSKSVKQFIKNRVIDFYIFLYNSPQGRLSIEKKINKLERTTLSYKAIFLQLKKEQPDFIFCTNQRPVLAVAPLLAAKDLGIPTATFIFSWDNLPKATKVVETDYYFVWSDFMKNELLTYYPSILEHQIKVTGTPQFEPHFNTELIQSREEFCKENNLDIQKRYICFSGDDITTSPYDEFYLQDLATVVENLNKKGANLGVIYRKCPVDFTNREKSILEKHKNTIYPIDPKWENLGNSWNTIMPLKEDIKLLVNTIKHSILVVNIGSSMVFDAVSHKIPCAYINYNTNKVDTSFWDIKKIYKFIHFKSMPSKEAVFWVNNKQDYILIIEKILHETQNLEETKKWFDLIAKHPQKNASDTIIKEINKCID